MLSLRSGCLSSRKLLSRTSGLVAIFMSGMTWSVGATGTASAQTLTTLTSFDTTHGKNPYAGLIADAQGNLFGTTVSGGMSGYGTVFELQHDSTAGTYASTPATLFDFDWSHGADPEAGLIANSNGDLLGTTNAGGSGGLGTAFQLSYDATAGSYSSTPNALLNFASSNGAQPEAGLIADSNGNLFGTTYAGGSGGGTVFEIPYDTSTGSYGEPVTLVSFDGPNGSHPEASLSLDANRNLIGTTFQGGANGQGTVFEIPYDASTSSYSGSTNSLIDFNGSNGSYPQAGLVADGNGNLFGTTYSGGATGQGTVFEIPYDATTSSYGTATTLVSFNGTNGWHPEASLIIDANGSLFGTTAGSGSSSYGTVFEIPYTLSTNSYATSPTVLITFSGSNGSRPRATLIADATGNLFGTTDLGGYYSSGTVFEVTNSGFVPPRRFAGTPGAPNCTGVSSSELSHTYGGLSHAAASLGYPSVAALQSTVSSYCGQ